MQAVAAALADDDGTLAGRLAAGEPVEIAVGDGGSTSIGPGDVQLVRDARSGMGVASEGDVTVALELEITPELRSEGLARELIRIVNDARKAAGLEVTDRIELAVETSGEPAAAFDAHRTEIAAETLASAILPDGVEGFRQEAALEGTPVVIGLRRSD